MRILLCNFEYPPLGGGGGVATELLAQELARKNAVTVLTSRAFDLPEVSEDGGVRVVRVPVVFRTQYATATLPSMLSYMPSAAARGRRLLREDRYDLVNSHFVLPTGPVGHAIAKHGQLPHVLSVHGGDLFDPSKWSSPHRHWPLRVWIRRLLRQADLVVGQSRNTVDNIREIYDASVQPARIPLAIKRPPARRAKRADFSFTEHDTLLVSIGRLVPRKAIDQLIHVVGDLASEATHLLLIGSGPEEPRLRRLASERGVARQVHFLGQLSENDKFRVLHMADLFVSTSQHEGFGLVFLEAMACGLPIICYDQGGQTDFLSSGQTGYLLPLNDREQFVQRCRELSTDRARRNAYGLFNRKRVEEYYIDTCAARYEDLFQQVVRQHRHRKERSLANAAHL